MKSGRAPGNTAVRLAPCGVVIALLMLNPPSLAAQGIEIQDCVGTCDLRVRSVTTLGADDGGADPSIGQTNGIVRLADGAWVVVDYPYRLLRFEADGSFTRAAGRQGQGPGEFANVAFMWRSGRSEVTVLDPNNARLTTLDRDLAVVSTEPLVPTVRPRTLTHLPDGRRVANAQIPFPENVGLPLHLTAADGTLLRSFGASPPIRDPRDGPAHVRTLAPAGAGSVWSSHRTTYRLEEWSVEGEILRTLERRAPWFPPGRHAGDPSYAGPPEPAIPFVSRDEDGLLWVVVWVAGENWEEGVGMRVGPDGRPYRGVVDRNVHLDTVVEVLDPDGARVLGRTRFDRPLVPVEAGIYYFTEFTDRLEVRIRILELLLEP